MNQNMLLYYDAFLANRYAPEPQQKPPSAAANRNKEELEYLEKLKQIRQQNYNERRNLQARQAAEDAEERKKKIEALRV